MHLPHLASLTSKQENPRNVLLEFSLDWFPPFKTDRHKSFGLVAAFPAALPLEAKSKMEHCWTLALIDGPKEPTFCGQLLAPLIDELVELSTQGMDVWDALTEKTIHIKCGIALIPGDLPALAKIGDHTGHSAQSPCHRDTFTGEICGHLDRDRVPPKYDNYCGQPRRIVSGDRERLRINGEHFAFYATL